MNKYKAKFLIIALLFSANCFSNEMPKTVSFTASIEYYSVDQDKGLSYQSRRVPYVSITNSFKKHALANGVSYESLLRLNEAEQRDIVKDITSYERYDLSEDARTVLIDNAFNLFSLSQVESMNEMNQFLSNKMESKSFGEKISFLTNLLSYTADNYEYEMLEKGTIERRISNLDVLQAINKSIKTGESAPGGICRHIHQLAIHVANGMGLQNVFGVGYRSQGAGHRTLIVGVPGDSSQVIQLNYGEEVIVKSTGGASTLSQNHSIPDSGITFRIYNSEDKTAIVLPTEQGALLNLVSGGKDSDLGAQFRSHSQINQVGIQTPYGHFRVFNARSSKDFGSTKISGLVYEKDFSFFDIFHSSFGFAGFKSERDLIENNLLTVNGIYFRNDTGFNWKFYTSNSIELNVFHDIHLRATYYCSYLNNSKCEKNYDGYTGNESGLTATIKLKNGYNSISIKAESQMAPKHATYKTTQTLIVPSITLTNKLSLNLTDDFVFNNKLSITRYDLGQFSFNVFDTENIIKSKRYGLDVFSIYQRPITTGTPIWLPGGQKTNIYGLRKTFLNDKLQLSTRYETYDDGISDNIGLSLRIDL